MGDRPQYFHCWSYASQTDWFRRNGHKDEADRLRINRARGIVRDRSRGLTFTKIAQRLGISGVRARSEFYFFFVRKMSYSQQLKFQKKSRKNRPEYLQRRNWIEAVPWEKKS